MLTAQKLMKVKRARGLVGDTMEAVEELLDEEENVQPPPPRRVALEGMVARLEDIDRELDKLWS